MDAIDPDEPAPLVPGRGRLTLVFLLVMAVGLAIGTLYGGSSGPADKPPGALVGSPAPEVVIDLFDGTTWRLSDHLASDGRPVVLNLWASWCIPCRTEIPELTAFAESNPGIAVIGVAVDDQLDAARSLAFELQPTYPVGMDATSRLRERYPSFGMPFTVIIDQTGIVRHEVVGGVSSAQLAGFFD